jgi:Tfp pilus assembly protein PilO
VWVLSAYALKRETVVAMLEHDPDKKLRILGFVLHAAGLAIVLLVAGVGYGLLLAPMERRTEDCQARCLRLEARLSGLEALRARQQELDRRWAALAQDAAALGKRVPDEPLEAEFLSQVAAAASQVGLKILDYRPAVAGAQESCSQIEIQLSCSGPYRSLCGFLQQLAALERLSRVTHAEIAAAGPEGCTINLTLVVFFGLKRGADARARDVPPGGVAHG